MSTFAWARRPGAKATTTPEPSPSPAYDAAIVRLGAGLGGAGVHGRSNTAQGTVTDEALCCLQGEQEVRYGQARRPNTQGGKCSTWTCYWR